MRVEDEMAGYAGPTAPPGPVTRHPTVYATGSQPLGLQPPGYALFGTLRMDDGIPIALIRADGKWTFRGAAARILGKERDLSLRSLADLLFERGHLLTDDLASWALAELKRPIDRTASELPLREVAYFTMTRSHRVQVGRAHRNDLEEGWKVHQLALDHPFPMQRDCLLLVTKVGELSAA